MLYRGMSRGPLARLASVVLLLVIGFLVLSNNSTPISARLQDASASWSSGATSSVLNDNPNNITAFINHTANSHLELRSLSTPDGKYWNVKFSHTHPSANVNFVPHYAKNDTWWIVAQKFKFPGDYQMFFTQLVCEASFADDGVLRCNQPPMILPIQGTDTDKCNVEDMGFWNFNIGPHDARVFSGPKAPYIIYGTQSKWHCMGLYIQDFRRLTDFSEYPTAEKSMPFFWPTDIERPKPHGLVEKNYFAFWDQNDDMYIHVDLPPNRSFARLYPDGKATRNLAPLTEKKDAKCVADHMPKVLHNGQESNHQATNSLAVTMCKRSDKSCKPTKDNTFIFAFFQAKTFYYAHGIYEPFLMVFRNTAPFSLYGFSKRPIWIHGRGEADGDWGKGNPETYAPASNLSAPQGQTEMVYVTSMAWKERANKYQAYLDDVLWLGFGVEDRKSGGIDILAETLMSDLNLC